MSIMENVKKMSKLNLDHQYYLNKKNEVSELDLNHQ